MRLIVADDAALLREGLIGLLQRQGHKVLAQASTAPELEAVVHTTTTEGEPPDVVITDVRMPPTMTDDGLAVAIRLRANHPGIGVLVLSQYVATAHTADLFAMNTPSLPPGHAAGGIGYLLKERVARVSDFLDSLDMVASGGIVVDPEIATHLIARKHTALDRLSTREHEVLALMAQGLSNPQIAHRLTLSAGAVAKHVAGIFTGLGLAPSEDNRRVRAVLTYLSATQT